MPVLSAGALDKRGSKKHPGADAVAGAGWSDREYTQEAGADHMLLRYIFNLEITDVDKSGRVSVFL